MMPPACLQTKSRDTVRGGELLQYFVLYVTEITVPGTIIINNVNVWVWQCDCDTAEKYFGSKTRIKYAVFPNPTHF